METLMVIGLIYFFTWLIAIIIHDATYNSFSKDEYVAIIPTVAMKKEETKKDGLITTKVDIKITWIGWKVNFISIKRKVE